MEYDIVINGSGLVGLTLANALAQKDFTVLVLDKAEKPVEVYDKERTLALSAGVKEYLDSLGIWGTIDASAEKITQIHVSEKGSFGVTRLNAEDYRTEALGFVLRNYHLQQQLQQCAQEDENISLQFDVNVFTSRFTSKGVDVEYTVGDSNNTIRCALLIGCEGTNSAVAGDMGAQHAIHDYQQLAVIANVKTEFLNKGVAYERFTGDSITAMLPLEPQISSLVMSLPADQAQAVLQLEDEAFLQVVQDKFGNRLGGFQSASTRVGFPLRLVQADRQVEYGETGVRMLVGNSARTMHPVAGQGYNLAARDLRVLVDMLDDWSNNTEKNISQLSDYIDKYENYSAQLKKPVISFTHNMVRLFTSTSSITQQLRKGLLFKADVLPGFRHLVSSNGAR